jgi:hypothetical protein
MGNYKITEIGEAVFTISKRKNPCLNLKFKPGVFENINKEDFENKIYVMLDKAYEKDVKKYKIIGLMPNDYDLLF